LYGQPLHQSVQAGGCWGQQHQHLLKLLPVPPPLLLLL
jgi:hypothetical protein